MSSSAEPNPFELFVLAKSASDPSLIGETARTLRTDSGALTLSDEQRRLLMSAAETQHNGSRRKHDTTLPTHLPSVARAEVAVLLQRALVDSALLPMGGSQLLYEKLWSVFLAAATCAREVYESRQRLQHAEQVSRQQQQQQQQQQQSLLGSKCDGEATLVTHSDTLHASSPSPPSASLDPAVTQSAAVDVKALRENYAVAQSRLCGARAELRDAFAHMTFILHVMTRMAHGAECERNGDGAGEGSVSDSTSVLDRCAREAAQVSVSTDHCSVVPAEKALLRGKRSRTD